MNSKKWTIGTLLQSLLFWMSTVTWSHIIGGISTGKTTVVEELIQIFLQSGKVQIAGFYQPGHFSGDVRDGYYLNLIRKSDIISTRFAFVNPNAKPGTIPYFFDKNGFEAVLSEAKSFRGDDRPVILFIDELAQLEINRKGHYAAIYTWIQTLKSSRKAVIIACTNEKRLPKCCDFMNEMGVRESSIALQTPADADKVIEYSEELLASLQ